MTSHCSHCSRKQRSLSRISISMMMMCGQVILGSVAVARTRVESPACVRARVTEALRHIEAERLILAPDCGLGMLSPDIIRQKLRVIREVANEF